MKITIADDTAPFDFECGETFVSRWISREILTGKTYPYLPFVEDVEVIFDVGANCGATSVHFARHYPEAQIHAFEPGSEQRAILERNAAEYPGIRVHGVGLYSVDEQVALYGGDGDTITASIFPRGVNLAESEVVQLRSAEGWVAEHGIDRIDILKLDVEGCEVDVLESLHARLPDVKVLYAEYDSRHARRRIAELVEDSHELFLGRLLVLDQGECIYVAKSLVDHPDANEFLKRLFSAA